MATKTIVRWKPSSPVYGRREFSAEDFAALGIFTQRKGIAFDKGNNYWLDADEAEISPEAREWLVNNSDVTGSFTVEEQDVPDEPDGGTPEAEMSAEEKETLSAAKTGESATTSQSAAQAANTTTSTATSTRTARG